MNGPSKARFETIFAKGRRHSGPTLRLVVLSPGTGLFGVATSKKLGEKPPRNRQKRRVREAFRLGGGLPATVDGVVIASERVATVPFSALLDEARELLGRLDAGA